MIKKLLFALALVLAISLALASLAVAQDDETLFRVDLRNKSDQPVTIVLTGSDVSAAYALTLAPGTSRVFTIKEGIYTHTSYACGESATGTLDVAQQLRLVFMPCFSDAPNAGAPTMEKIFLPDTPDGINWFYQLD